MKKRNVLICLLVAMFSFLLFGCEQKVAVENIYFNAPSADGVVLLVGDVYTPEVYFSPTYPTNKGYKIISGNEKIISSRNNKLTALTPGKTYIKVVADENELIQDAMTVQVVASRTKLATPTVAYSAEKQAFTISSASQDGLVNGYTIEINGESIDVGNVQEYTLADYNKHLQASTSTAGISAYDRDLTVRVQATVPNYTSAFENSNFSQTIKINQASAPIGVSVVGGKLNISKSKATQYKVFVNSTLFATTNKTVLDLAEIDKNYANSTLQISVVAVSSAGDGVEGYNSLPVVQQVKCVENVEANMVGEIISWNRIEGIEKYELSLGTNKTAIASTSVNYFDLKTLLGYETMFETTNQPYQLTIKPILSNDCRNIVLSKNQQTTIKFNRLANPVLTCTNNVVSWNEIANAKNYQLIITNGQGTEIVNIATEKRVVDFGLAEFESNQTYTIKVLANFAVKDDVFYLSSKTEELNVEKVAKAQLSIVDSKLLIESVVDDEFLVEIFSPNNQSVYSNEFTAVTNPVSVDLQKLGVQFVAGTNKIQVKHLGNSSNKIDSEIAEISFVQLEDIENISISNSCVSVIAGVINTTNSATLKFEIFKGSDFVTQIENGANLADLNLEQGEYTINLSVLGYGSKTLSVVDQLGNAKICASRNFNVLPTPTISTQHKTAEFNIIQQENVSAYQIAENGNITTVSELNYAFDLASGQTRTFTIRALGDGETYINSRATGEFVFTRLATPELTFNNTNNSITSNLGESAVYELKFNNNDITASYTFGETLTDLIVGTNYFELTEIAQYAPAVNYINSFPCSLQVNKATAESSITIAGNKLVIAPIDNVEQMTLEISFASASQTLVITENDYQQQSEQLDLKKIGNGYSLNLLNDTFEPILNIFANEFSVKVRYLASHSTEGDSLITTEYSQPVQVKYATATTFDMSLREDQKITFNSAATYSYNDYLIIVNDSYLLFLNESAEVNNEQQKIKFDADYVYNNVSSPILQEINKLTIVTRNTKTTESNLLLSNRGESIYIARAQSVDLTSTKNNAVEFGNNSRIISFEDDAKEFERTFMLKVYNDIDSEDKFTNSMISASPNDKSAINYSFNLDEMAVNLTGSKKIAAFVRTNSSKTQEIDGELKTIYMFNSLSSNILEFEIVEMANISTDGTKLIVNLPDNVDGVDIYKQTVSGLVKLNTNLVESSFDLGINDGELTLFVRTIAAEVGNFTNSGLNEQISLIKLASPIVGVEDGRIVVTVDNKTAELFNNTQFDPNSGIENLNGCVLRVVNKSLDRTCYVYLGADDVTIDENKIIIEPEYLLQYGVTTLAKEGLEFDCLAQVNTGEIFLNSNKTSADFYGLIAPIKVNLPAVVDPKTEKVQTISWQDTGLNKLSNGTDVLLGYLLEVVDTEGNEYLSSDNLVYLQFNAEQNNYVETEYPSIITANNCAFPYGYRNTEGEIVKFKTGKYQVYIKALPKTSIAGYNLCNSKYSQVCSVTLLNTPAPTVIDGVIGWDKVDGATEYAITITSMDDPSKVESTLVYTNKFAFEGFDALNGNFNITIRALSNLQNVVGSEESEPLSVHRLAPYSSVIVDDGVLILKTSILYREALINFRNTETGEVETLTYSNPHYATIIDELVNNQGLSNWQDVHADIYTPTIDYLVKIDESFILKLSKGSYTVSVQLIGNSRSNFSVVSSIIKQEDNVNSFVKLAFDSEKQDTENKTWIRVDERGVFTFACPEEYALGGLNYQFNTQDTDVDYSFFKNVIIYKITVKINNTEHNLFAIDYYNYINNKSKLSSSMLHEFENDSLFAVVNYPYTSVDHTENLYFCVFKDNQINLNLDEFHYYSTTQNYGNDGVSIATSINQSNEKGYYSVSLIEGGVFVVEVGLLGSDLTAVVNDGTAKVLAYLTSNIYTSKSFIRYTDNNLQSYINYSYSLADGETSEVSRTYSGELIFQNKIKYDEQGNALDYPVYQLEISPIVYYDGHSVETAPFIYYLYHDQDTVQKVAADNPISSFTAKEFVEVQKLEHNDSYLRFDFSKYFGPGNYSIKIRTLAGVGSNNLDSKYLLNSRLPSSGRSFNRISNTDLKVANGKLQFDLAYVINAMAKTYITDYEIVITSSNIGQTEEYSLKINQFSQGVSIADNVLTYTLPETIEVETNNGASTQSLTLNNGERYSLKVRAIQTAEKDTGMLNATFVQQSGADKITTIEKSQGFEIVDIKQGLIVWKVKDEQNYNGVIIRIEFEDGKVVEEAISKDRTMRKSIDGVDYCYYEIGDNEYNCVDGVAKVKISAGNYNLKMLTIGKFDTQNSVEILNSNFTQAKTIKRLAKVKEADIVSNAGVLTWKSDDQQYVDKYVVTLSGNKTYSFTTNQNSIDFANILDDNGLTLEVGTYSVTIRALGNECISSMQSNVVGGFAKLAKVEQLSEVEDYVTWQAVEGAQGYNITFKWYVDGNQMTETKTVLATEELKCTAPENMSGSYSVEIQAIGVGSGKVFNGDLFTFEGSTERPIPVGEITFNTTDLCLYIPLSENLKTNDIIRISYNIAKYNFTSSGSGLDAVIAEIVEIENSSDYIKTIDGKIYCVYPMATAGKYSSISVNIVRKGSLTSTSTPYADIDFNYFAYGDGSQENPYGLATTNHLLNIAFRADKCFELVQTIDMTNVDFEAQLNAKGAIIAENFTGVLNGNGRAIIGLNNVSVSNGNVSNFQGLALFKKITNATIKNINFAETDNNATKFVNIFAQKQANVLKYSLIAMTSTNSLIADVTMPKAIFVVEGSGMLQNDAYIGGLVAESYNTTFSGCIANITVEFNADFSTTLGSVYIGGLTGYAVDCKVQSSTRATTVGISVVQGKTNRRFKAIGGVAGYFEAENLAASIDGVEATVTQITNIYVDHFGGIVGYAIGATITNCLAQGSITHSALEKTNTGALVGQLQGGSVTDCTIKVEFDLTISNYNYTNIGFVAGYVTSYNQVQANIANCKINQTFTNKTKISADHTSVEEMGIYGDGPTNYSPSGCTKID